jgi:DNA-binding MarR family transcriptional regulator
MDPVHPGDRAPLAGALLGAADWFNDALVLRLAERGWPRLTRNQSRVFALMPPRGARPVELARAVGITRQSMHTLLRGLADEGLLSFHPDPDDLRSVVVRLTPRGQDLVRDAGEILGELEEVLTDRIGAREVAALRRILEAPWGPPPVGQAGDAG